ncbi:phosphopantothenoylcysteine decarboxylase [Cladophialophora yegresii CBS 114405]|uniref:Phosphopantothenoylcysteine decarboxylase n=1 Tax=Cladophialophora yegresii CBS 114405 TaxID=1182544 RepID=W9W0Z5_9EURO|nr:phosphopantothenoylcysteine decarboxylase [Cladophialophora yegresii CBS 114405]EXJ58645.1 phosphopantothenoylcysteine decarboxylase [Cladophialophora yegresii CBS 114405]
MTTNPTTSGERFSAAAFENDGRHHILLGASGSVATIKIPLIAQALGSHANVSIRIVLTEAAEQFLQGQSSEQPTLSSLINLPNVDGIYHDDDEWSKPWVRGDKILHIELRRWAHVLVVAPLSANSLAKMVNGMSDGLLLNVIRAWDTTGLIDMRKKRIFVAPAMNTAMWRHPITRKQIKVLDEDWGESEDGWVTILRPTEKELACGDTGDGAMMDWKQIVARVGEYLTLGEEGDEVNGV